MANTGYFAIINPVYTPATRLVISITNGNPATVTTGTVTTSGGNIVTTASAHGYVTGTIVRINTSSVYGMGQINQQTAAIVVTGDTTFTIAIDTTNYDTFSIPSTIPAHTNNFPNVVPIGEINSILTASVQNILPNQVG
ncbi:MAG TPA: ubiquitin-activating E1 FCCH domain-containing protein [Bacteroidia bacterium]|jgi:hypothetical protein|nr:ubiquitin-activating E1 FCCH domain-containing protein [Bacteroidia bacterium]